MSAIQNVSFANLTTPVFQRASDVAYGSFSSTQTQPVSDLVATPILYDTEDIAPVGMFNGPSLDSITVLKAGVYKVLASAQCDNAAVGVLQLDMWLKLGVNNLPNSATRIAINQNQEVVLTVEWIVEVAAGEIISINCLSSAPGPQLLAVPAGVIAPAIPSIITTVVRIA